MKVTQKKIQLAIPLDLETELRIYAAKNRLKLKDIAQQAIEEFLKKYNTETTAA